VNAEEAAKRYVEIVAMTEGEEPAIVVAVEESVVVNKHLIKET
jgi:hypothetical protein